MRQHLVLYSLLGWLHSFNNSLKQCFFIKAYDDEVTKHWLLALDENGNSVEIDRRELGMFIFLLVLGSLSIIISFLGVIWFI